MTSLGLERAFSEASAAIPACTATLPCELLYLVLITMLGCLFLFDLWLLAPSHTSSSEPFLSAVVNFFFLITNFLFDYCDD